MKLLIGHKWLQMYFMQWDANLLLNGYGAGYIVYTVFS